MRRIRPIVSLVFVAAVLVAAIGGTATADSGGAPNDNAAFGQSHRPVCPPAAPEQARCHSEVVTQKDGATPAATTSYTSGYNPADLASAYKYSLPASGSPWIWNGQTVALVLAYDYPSAEADLGVYRAQFGLPACTTANGCFLKVNQNGLPASYPSPNVGWAQESALDLDMASAACPNCKLLLVEATSNSFVNLGAAVNTAATLGANVISNSYGANEFSSETSYEGFYNHPNKAITVSSGDSGWGAEFPAASRYVTAVGGTKLTKNTSTSRGWTETAWSGAGSGCSAYVAKPAWQSSISCARRMISDVSAVADPNTGVAVYISYGSSGGANWYVFGGTSVAAPFVGGTYGRAANSSGIDYPVRYAYNNPGALFDVTSGTNGKCRRFPAYYCTALVGYDGPTGLGTPNGIGAF